MAQCSASEQLWPWSHAPGHFIRSEFLCTHGPKLYIPKASPPREAGLDLLQIREEKKASPCWINSPKNGYPNQGLGTSLVNPFEGITSLSIQVTSSLDLGSGLQVLSLVNHTAVRRQSGSVYDCLRNGDGIKKLEKTEHAPSGLLHPIMCCPSTGKPSWRHRPQEPREATVYSMSCTPIYLTFRSKGLVPKETITDAQET